MSNPHYFLVSNDVTGNPSGETHAGATESSGEESLFASLGLNPQLFAWQLVNFALVGLVVWYLILKPLTKKMDERKRFIDDSLQKAKQVEAEVKLSTAKAQEIIDEAKVEANHIVARAQEEAVAAGNRLKQKAKEDIELLVQQAKKNIEIDRVDMCANIRRETVTLVIAAVEKLLGKKLDDKNDEAFIKDILKDVK